MNPEININHYKIANKNEFIEPSFCSVPIRGSYEQSPNFKIGSQQILIDPINSTIPDTISSNHPNFYNPNFPDFNPHNPLNPSFPDFNPRNPLNQNSDYADENYIRNESIKLALSVFGLSSVDYNFMSLIELENKKINVMTDDKKCALNILIHYKSSSMRNIYTPFNSSNQLNLSEIIKLN